MHTSIATMIADTTTTGTVTSIGIATGVGTATEVGIAAVAGMATEAEILIAMRIGTVTAATIGTVIISVGNPLQFTCFSAASPSGGAALCFQDFQQNPAQLIS
jgi:hypothetical protein